jgi:hypothetical protein
VGPSAAQLTFQPSFLPSSAPLVCSALLLSVAASGGTLASFIQRMPRASSSVSSLLHPVQAHNRPSPPVLRATSPRILRGDNLRLDYDHHSTAEIVCLRAPASPASQPTTRRKTRALATACCAPAHQDEDAYALPLSSSDATRECSDHELQSLLIRCPRGRSPSFASSLRRLRARRALPPVRPPVTAAAGAPSRWL